MVLFIISFLYFRSLGLKNGTSFLFTIILFYVVCFLIKKYFLVSEIHNLRMIALGRLDSITSGVLVTVITLNYEKKIKNILTLLGILLLGISLVLIYFLKINYTENILLLCLIPLSFSLLLPIFEKLKFPENKFDFIRNAVTNLSLWSYSIYLCHIPIIFSLYYFTDGLINNIFLKFSIKILGLILTIIFSKWLFFYFETPLINKRPKEIKLI